MAELIVALDLSSARRALALVDRLGEAIACYKLGPQLYTPAGPQVVAELRARGKRVFLDLKLHDIPNTVGRAVEAAAELGVELVTLHASGGSAMMRAARLALGDGGPRLLAVTLLTSLRADDVEEVWGKELRSLQAEVARLTALAVETGLDGVVASVAETRGLKRRYGRKLLVATPGIRPARKRTDDQARVATPAEAVRAGADLLIVGRPVVEAPDPVAVVQQMLEETAAAQEVQA